MRCAFSFGGEANEQGIEVFEDLPPKIVDGAVAFIGNNEVEGFDRDGGVVDDVLWPLVCSGDFETRFFIEVFLQFLTAEQGVEALDGANGDPVLHEVRARQVEPLKHHGRSIASSRSRVSAIRPARRACIPRVYVRKWCDMVFERLDPTTC
jgi:hypothetical protein